MFQKSVLRDCISMCFDICTINIRVSIWARGLHLVLFFLGSRDFATVSCVFFWPHLPKELRFPIPLNLLRFQLLQSGALVEGSSRSTRPAPTETQPTWATPRATIITCKTKGFARFHGVTAYSHATGHNDKAHHGHSSVAQKFDPNFLWQCCCVCPVMSCLWVKVLRSLG